MLRIGIIGCGKIAQVRHIPEYIASGRAEIVALYDINVERAAGLAERYGARACASLDELLDQKLDAVSICTANHTHAEYAVRALDKGLDVLCEKPMATSLEDCQAMEVCGYCGVRILATAHAGGLQELNGRPVYRRLLETGLFTTAVCLRKDQTFTVERLGCA